MVLAKPHSNLLNNGTSSPLLQLGKQRHRKAKSVAQALSASK